MIAKLVVGFMSIVLSAILGMWSMIYGWGIPVQNWSVVIWAYVLQFVIIGLMQAATGEKS